LWLAVAAVELMVAAGVGLVVCFLGQDFLFQQVLLMLLLLALVEQQLFLVLTRQPLDTL
jgi:hypothetical protein